MPLTLLGVLIAGLTIYGIFAVSLTKKAQVNGPIQQDIVMGKDLVTDILPPPKYILEPYLTAYQLADRTNLANVNSLVDRFRPLENDFNSRYEHWDKTLPDGSSEACYYGGCL